MGKKVSRAAKAKGEGQFAGAINKSAKQIWLAGLGAFSKAQDEGNRVFNSLVKEGERAQRRARKVARKAQADAARLLKDLRPPR